MLPEKEFEFRHLGPRNGDINEMLKIIGIESIEQLISETVPSKIRNKEGFGIGKGQTEYEYLTALKNIASKNIVAKNYIGLGYHGTITPGVIQRNIFENPGWYTQYTPYQAEIAQGRLEALLNFQTMVSDLTGFPVANASLLDEGTAAAEAMLLLHAQKNKKNKHNECNKFFVSDDLFPQTLDVLKGRALPRGIEIIEGKASEIEMNETFFGQLLQYPNGNGLIEDYTQQIAKAKNKDIYTVLACDLLSLTLLKSPEELGADIALGNSQRFGVPMGFGGPHAAYFACKEEFTRQIPGRIIGVSVDKHGNKALRMALQTREQHIKREKATSNICTAQALLAIMAGMYAVYHGSIGLKHIANTIHSKAVQLASELKKMGFQNENTFFFDTLKIKTTKEQTEKIKTIANNENINFRYFENNHIGISIDETTSKDDLNAIILLFGKIAGFEKTDIQLLENPAPQIQNDLVRNTEILSHPVFNTHHSETEMLRYIKRLENKDLSLTLSMIPLGSCTMKLNATSELIPLSWPEFSSIHPFAPANQTKGYIEILDNLASYLSKITGFDACSLQPNSGAQGEYAGLMVIRAYHISRGDSHRKIALIPTSAHGTNPASAAIAGMDIVLVACDEMGNINVADLKEKAEKHQNNLSCLMVTYPSTHGVFEESINEICDIIHVNGGKVYMDGANMNAQVGLTSPASIGADVCHLNLHKTFAIPHGGGGPGMGPICVRADLAPFLPSNPFVKTGGENPINSISATPFGSTSILLISYAYIKMLGDEGLTNATKYAILNANYLKAKLETHYPILYAGKNGRVAHEFIIDIRPTKIESGIDAADIAKRLMDYGFHAPTVAFPVVGTLMIEPTESEPKEELDRFCAAMIAIRREIQQIIDGEYTKEDNPIIQAPHTSNEVCANEWKHTYSRETAAFPIAYLHDWKFWPSVGKIDNTHGDRNLICTCPPIESYA
jgi:glycine dehydrogenase